MQVRTFKKIKKKVTPTGCWDNGLYWQSGKCTKITVGNNSWIVVGDAGELLASLV